MQTLTFPATYLPQGHRYTASNPSNKREFCPFSKDFAAIRPITGSV